MYWSAWDSPPFLASLGFELLLSYHNCFHDPFPLRVCWASSSSPHCFRVSLWSKRGAVVSGIAEHWASRHQWGW